MSLLFTGPILAAAGGAVFYGFLHKTRPRRYGEDDGSY